MVLKIDFIYQINSLINNDVGDDAIHNDLGSLDQVL